MNLRTDGTLDDFLTACGTTTGLQIAVRPSQGAGEERHSLRLPFAVIGRHSRCDVPVFDWLVSTRHAYLQVFKGAVFCLDLGSRTGLHWRSGKQGSGWWHANDVLFVGQNDVQLVGPSARLTVPEGKEPPIPLHRPEDEDAMPSVWLEFLHAKPGERVWRVSRPMVLVGRAPWCKLQLAHRSVSQAHCALLWLNNALWCVDLASRSGLVVNNMPQRWALLGPGSTLEIGVFRIRCHYTPPRDATSVQVAEPISDGAGNGDGDSSVDGESDGSGGVESDSETESAPSDVMPPTAAPSDVGNPVPSASMMEEALPERVHARPELLVTPGETSGASVPAPHMDWMFDQLVRLQQQTFDQFQQLLLVVVQSFARMHREQTELLARELDALTTVNRELAWLRAKLAGVQMHPSATQEQSPPADRPRARVRVTLSRQGKEPHSGSNKDVSSPPKAQSTPPSSQPADTGPEPSALPTGVEQGIEQPDPMPRNGQGLAPGDDIHAWLCRRIAELEKEQKTRWQRLLSLLTGGRGGGGNLP